MLEANQRIRLADGENLPGTTGLRALASVLNQHGEPVMLSAYDRAAALRPGRKVVVEAVHAALRGLVAAAEPHRLDSPGEDPPREDYEDEREEEDEQPEEAHEVFDRAYKLREILNDFLIAVGQHQFAEARRALNELAEEQTQLLDALHALEDATTT